MMKFKKIVTTITILSAWLSIGQNEDPKSGSWIGSIMLGGAAVDLVLNIPNNDNEASLGIPSKGIASLPFEKFTLKGDSIIAEIPSAQVGFKGLFFEKSKTIKGVWIQGPEKYELNMTPLVEEIDYSKSKLESRGSLTEEYASEHFIFYSEKNDFAAIDTLAKSLERSFENLSEKFGAKFDKKVEVYIYPNLDRFHKAIYQPNAPDWVVGAASVNEIKMVSPLNPGPVHTSSSVMQSIIHEFVHVIVLNVSADGSNSVPHWLNEGIAFYEANQLTEPMKASVKNSIEKRTASSWDNLMQLHPIEFGEIGGYQQSASIVGFLIENYGYQKLKKFIQSPGDIESIYKVGQAALENKWMGYVLSSYTDTK